MGMLSLAFFRVHPWVHLGGHRGGSAVVVLLGLGLLAIAVTAVVLVMQQLGKK